MSDSPTILPTDIPHSSDGHVGEKLPWEEIRRYYPDRWVALVDYDAPHMQVTAGIVYAHDPNRAVISQMTQHLLNATILWTGKRPVFLPPRCFRVDR
jgi:hypothetical protein